MIEECAEKDYQAMYEALKTPDQAPDGGGSGDRIGRPARKRGGKTLIKNGLNDTSRSLLPGEIIST